MILYTQNCPKCEVLKKKLLQNDIFFKTSNDFSKLVENHIDTLPVLEVNGSLLEFPEAITFINNLINEKIAKRGSSSAS